MSNPRDTPNIDYTATSFQSLIDTMYRYAQEKYGNGGPVAWTDFNPNNPGTLLFDVTAICGEMLAYMLNAYAREQVITTCVRAQSFINLAKSYDYELLRPSQATVTMTITSNPAALPYTLSASTFKVSNGASNNPVVFMPILDTTITSVVQEVPFIEGSLIANELLGTSDGTQFQRMELANVSAIRSTLSVLVNGVEWKQYENYTDMNASTQGYVLEDTERGGTLIKFGDGINGRVPSSATDVRANYKVGGGPRGQVGPNALTTILTPATGVLSVSNYSTGTGGSPGQTVADGQKALPSSLSTLHRAVADGDYAAQALNVPGVAKATDLPGSIATKQILLPIAPAGGGIPSASLKNAVVNYFRNVKPLTFTVLPLDPYYLNLRIALDLVVKPNYRQTLVLAAVTRALLDMLSFDKLNFGSTVRLQDIYDNISPQVPGLEGIAYINVKVLSALSAPRIPYGTAVTGNGTFDNLAVTNPQERTWNVFVAATTPYTLFNVTQTIVGNSSSVSDTVLMDETATWANNEHVGKVLNPNTSQGGTYTVVANTQTTLTIAAGNNMGSVAVNGNEYSIASLEGRVGKVTRVGVASTSPSQQKRLYLTSTANIAVGDTLLIRDTANREVGKVAAILPNAYVDLTTALGNTYDVGATVDVMWLSADGTLSFALVNGSVPFVTGDAFYVDTYPLLQDVTPRPLDLPQLLEANLAIRPVGGLS